MLPKEGRATAKAWGANRARLGEWDDHHLSPSKELPRPGRPGLNSKRPVETDLKFGSCSLGQGCRADQAQLLGPTEMFSFSSLLESEAKKLMLYNGKPSLDFVLISTQPRNKNLKSI